MSEWGQARGRLELDGKMCRLRVLDPETAFTLEPQLVAKLGETMLMTMATPAVIARAIADAVQPADETDASRARAVAAGIERISVFARELLCADVQGSWVIEMVEATLFDRLEVDRQPVDSWAELADTGLLPLSRWRLLAAQLGQTYGPLWDRSPYSASNRRPKDHGVPEPNASRTTQWAAQLASLGYASSAHEILTTWTPARVVDHVEIAAQAAEQQRRATDAARAKS